MYRSRYTGLLLLFASIGFSLVVAEVALRFVVKLPVPSYPPVNYRPDLYQQFDSYGYRLFPSRTTTYLYPHSNPRKLTLVSNSAGFRSSRELHEPDERVRILVVGDSFVFGDGVEEHERFTNILEKMEQGWRVDNLGMTGYGPDLMLRALEVVGLEPVPDVVVFSIYTDDFRRVRPYYAGVGFKIPRYKLKSGKLVTIPYPKLHLWEQLHIVQAIRLIYWKDAAFDLNRAILDRFLDLAKLHRFTPLIIFLPGRSDTKNDKKRRTWLSQYAERHETPFLDLTDHILSKGTDLIFIKNNWHLNPHGQQIVAIELHRFLAEQILKNP